jgi:quinol monooxygenase YgiN
VSTATPSDDVGTQPATTPVQRDNYAHAAERRAMIIIAGTIDIRPDQREKLLELAVPLMNATNAEPGNHEYVFSADSIDPGRVRIFELWEDEESIAPHFAQPHMAEFGKAMSQLTVTGSSVIKYTISGSAPLHG